MILYSVNLSHFTLEYAISSIAYFVSAFILLVVAKLIFQVVRPYYKVDDELVTKDNMAFAIAQVGYYVGVLAVIGAALYGESHGLLTDLINIGVYGGVGIILLNLSLLVNDYLILSKFKIRKEISDDQNAGTGVVAAASSIATGLVLLSAFTVTGATLLDSIACWAIAQLFLVIGAQVYNMVVPYNVHEHIEKDNVAVGVGFAGALLAIGIVVQFAVHDLLNGWLDFVVNLGIDALIGIVLIPVARLLTDKILLPKRKLTDELINQEKPNVGVALIEAFAYVGGALLITWVI